MQMMLTVDEIKSYVSKTYTGIIEPDEAMVMFMDGYLKGIEDARADVLIMMKNMGEEDDKFQHKEDKPDN